MQKKFPLEWFETFVSQTLVTARLNRSAINSDFIRESIRKAMMEKDHVRTELFTDMFSVKNEEGLRISIKRYQLLLIQLLDTLHEQGVPERDHRLLRILCDSIRDILKDILLLIEKHFSRYFDLEQKVPESYLSLSRKELLTGIIKLEDRLYREKQDDRLIQILISHIRAFAQNSRLQVTYREFIYLKDAWNELQHSRVYEKKGRSFPLLIEILIRVNYNTPVFVSYFMNEYISKKIDHNASKEERIKTIIHSKNRLNEINKLPNMRMIWNLPDITEQIIEKMQEELNYLLVVPGISQSEESVSSEYKIQTNLPVPLLAATFRIFKEGGVILNSNIKKLLEFIATYYSSLRQEKISYTHLHSSYYDISQRDKERLYDMLMKLAKECRRL